MDDAQRTHRILSGRFIAGAALPYTDEHGITWSLDFADVKGITRRMAQAEATTRRLEKELAVAEQEREAWMKEWARKGDRADRAKAESRRLREALEAIVNGHARHFDGCRCEVCIARAALAATPEGEK